MINQFQAYFYLLEAEQMPVDAPDEWFEPRHENVSRSQEQVATFITHAYKLIDDLALLETEEEYQVAFYDRAKKAFGEDKASIKTFFEMLYLLIFHRAHGPRWGQFVALIGRDDFRTRLQQRLENPLL